MSIKLLTLLVGILLAVAMVGPHTEHRLAQACEEPSVGADRTSMAIGLAFG
ncbi:MAG: hypothetical protein AAGA68_04945 [Pseudomonadota bacterium]